MPRHASAVLVALATLLAAPSATAALGDDGILVATAPYVTSYERGPDRDADGYPEYVVLHRERLVVYENGLAEREQAEPLRVTVDEHDRDASRPAPMPRAPVPTGFDSGGDADGDGIPDALVIRREYPSPGGSHGAPAEPLVVPVDPDPRGGGGDIPHASDLERVSLEECGHSAPPAYGSYCLTSHASLRWLNKRFEGPSVQVVYSVGPLDDPHRPMLRVKADVLGRQVSPSYG